MTVEPRGVVTRRRALLWLPVALSVGLLAWTGATNDASHAGSWHGWAVLANGLAVLVAHAVLIARVQPRARMVLYAGVHLVWFLPICMLCMMMVSKLPR